MGFEFDRCLRRPVRSLAQLPRTLDLGGDLVGSSRPRPLEEKSLPRRSPAPCSLAQMYLGAMEGEHGKEDTTWRASCDRLCRADGALGRSIHLQTFALRETCKEAAGLVERDQVAWMSQQAWYIAGQLVLGRTSLLWQLVWRITGRKRRGC